MQFLEALKQRKSVRAFLPKEVEKEKLLRILDHARLSPSGTNTQPWQVAVVTGAKRKDLAAKIEAAFRQYGEERMEYDYSPTQSKEPYTRRRVICGSQLYGALGIDRKNREQRLEHWATNYRGFDAPVLLFFFIDPELGKGSFLDYGMFLQSLMLAAVDEGLATCAQASLGHYPEVVKEALDYPRHKILVCGIALGYENTSAPVNNYRTVREEVNGFATFYE